MRKKWLSLLLALAMLSGLLIPTASADTVNLSDKAVTLSVTPSESTICVGSTGDVYVTYTISIEADEKIPAFQFRLPASDEKLAKQVQSKNPDWYYWFNADALKQRDEGKGGGGPYKVADYNPDKGYVGVGGSDDGKGLTKVTVMTTVAKFENGSVNTTYDLRSAITDFIAGGTKNDGGVNAANAFGYCVVNGATVTVKPGAAVSGTVKDDKGSTVSDAAVELYKDGTKVADAAMTGSTYTFSDVSTGTYTVKAKSSDGSLNGSASVTVTDGDITKNVTIAKGVTVSGTVTSYGDAGENVTVTLTKQGETAPAFTDTLTGATGSAPYSQTYSFPTVPAGTYTLKVEKKGHAPWTEEITVDTAAIAKDVTVYLWGDVNKDGGINGQDLQRLYEHLKGENPLPVEDVSLGNVNGDDTVNGQDWQRLYEHVKGEKPLT